MCFAVKSGDANLACSGDECGVADVRVVRVPGDNETVYYENFSHSEYTEDEAMQRFSQGSNRKVVPLELPYTTVHGLVKMWTEFSLQC